MTRCPRAEGPSIYSINPGTVLNLQFRPSIYMGYFPEMCNKSHWILQRIYRLTDCDNRTFALSRCFRVSRSRPRVFHETITVISLWCHNSGPCDNEESIADHNNAIPRTMGCITIYGSKGIWMPHKENKGIRIPYKENQVIRICRPRRLYQGLFRAKYWINRHIRLNYISVNRENFNDDKYDNHENKMPPNLKY